VLKLNCGRSKLGNSNKSLQNLGAEIRLNQNLKKKLHTFMVFVLIQLIPNGMKSIRVCTDTISGNETAREKKNHK
jgi:hypothetical protein